MAMQRAFTPSSNLDGQSGPIIDAVVLNGEIIDVAPPRQGWFGVMVCAVPLAPPLAEQTGQHAGLLIERVAKGSPAAQSGVRAADVLLRVNGTAVTYDGSLRVALTGRQHGEPVQVRLLRDGRARDVQVVVTSLH